MFCTPFFTTTSLPFWQLNLTTPVPFCCWAPNAPEEDPNRLPPPLLNELVPAVLEPNNPLDVLPNPLVPPKELLLAVAPKPLDCAGVPKMLVAGLLAAEPNKLEPVLLAKPELEAAPKVLFAELLPKRPPPVPVVLLAPNKLELLLLPKTLLPN